MQQLQAFTLVEIIVVVAIVGILSSVLLPNLILARGRASDASTMVYLRNCASAVEMSKNNVTGELPAGLNGQGCDSALLLPYSVEYIPAVVTSSSDIAIDGSKQVQVSAISVTGKTFTFDGARFVSSP